MKRALVSGSTSSISAAWPLSKSFLKAFSATSFTSPSLWYFLHCWSNTVWALSLLVDRKSLSEPLTGSVQIILLFGKSSSTLSLTMCVSASSLSEVFSDSSAFLQSGQSLHFTQRYSIFSPPSSRNFSLARGESFSVSEKLTDMRAGELEGKGRDETESFLTGATERPCWTGSIPTSAGAPGTFSTWGSLPAGWGPERFPSWGWFKASQNLLHSQIDMSTILGMSSWV